MKTPRSPRLILLAASVCCGLLAPQFAFAQLEAPVAATIKEKKYEKEGKTKGEKKPREKNLAPRVVEATEAAMGKALTPIQKDLLLTSLRERDAVVKAANDAYYNRFSQATGLTPEQAREIDKPARSGATEVEAPTAPKVEGTTNMDAPIETAPADEGAPVAPK